MGNRAQGTHHNGPSQWCAHSVIEQDGARAGESDLEVAQVVRRVEGVNRALAHLVILEVMRLE